VMAPAVRRLVMLLVMAVPLGVGRSRHAAARCRDVDR
jgi:hypothetical protein